MSKITATPFIQAMSTLVMLVAVPMPVLADVYPGDTAYSKIVQDVYHSVSSDRIRMDWKTNIRTRPQLCQELVKRHNNTAPVGGKTNASFLGVEITVNDCLNALYYSKGYKNASGWQAWAGQHQGTWFNQDGQSFHDAATWESSVRKRTQPQDNDLDSSRRPRVYDFQKVVFHDEKRPESAKYGWNQSHPEVAYVWGWDPKDGTNDNGKTGTHVGFTFLQDKASCIVWVTPKESFLECVSGQRRTSTGFWGVGQWSVK